FSSRRRHTRFSRDWSSDVCSSDLPKNSSTTSFPHPPTRTTSSATCTRYAPHPAPRYAPQPPARSPSNPAWTRSLKHAENTSALAAHAWSTPQPPNPTPTDAPTPPAQPSLTPAANAPHPAPRSAPQPPARSPSNPAWTRSLKHAENTSALEAHAWSTPQPPNPTPTGAPTPHAKPSLKPAANAPPQAHGSAPTARGFPKP